MIDLLFHGGNTKAAQAFFTNAPPNWLDLSTGISPWDYNRSEINLNTLKTLPQKSDIKDLETIAARYFGVKNDEIIAVSGSDIAIRILGKIFENEKINLLTPIFSGHSKAFPNAKPISQNDLQNLSGEYVVFANPNNPDGRVLNPEDILKSGIKFIADEAFMDLTPNNSLIGKGGIILRSFGKFFGLAGLRLGFVIGDREIIAKISQYMGDWPVSTIAVEIGKKAYADVNWHNEQRKRINIFSERLEKLFIEYGFEIIGSGGLFITIKYHQATELFHHLGRNAILTRPFDYAPFWLRFGLVKNDDEFSRLRAALKSWREINV